MKLLSKFYIGYAIITIQLMGFSNSACLSAPCPSIGNKNIDFSSIEKKILQQTNEKPISNNIAATSMPVQIISPSPAPSPSSALDKTLIEERPVLQPTEEIFKANSSAFNQVNKMTDQVLEKEIDLFKINTYFRVENNRMVAGKRLHYLIYQNINYAGTFAGFVVNVAYNFAWYRRVGTHTVYSDYLFHGKIPKFTYKTYIPTAIQMSATMPRFVGKFVLINGVLYEMIKEIAAKGKEKKRGFEVGQTDKRVHALSSEIQELLERRTRVLSNFAGSMSPDERSIAFQDSVLLSKGMHLAVNEYVRCHANSVARSTYNRLDTWLTFWKKMDGDFGADCVRIIGASMQDGYLSPVASMSTTISGAMSAGDPIVTIFARGIARRVARRTITKKLGEPAKDKNPLPDFEKMSHEYDSTVTKIDPVQSPGLSAVIKNRSALYHGMTSVYNDMAHVDKEANIDQKRHDKHSLIIHQIYGGSKYSRGAWLIYIGYHYIHSSRRNTELTACAGIINLAGAAIREADTLRTDVIEIWKRKELKAKRSVSAIILTGRLDTLEDMQTTLATKQ